MLEFNLRHLEAFAAAAELGSFTAAAEALYLTQSTVSAHIQTLERALDAPLFVRDAARRIHLTEAGRAAYPRAKAILEQCRALSEEVHAVGRQALVIAASTVPCQCLLPDLMAGFLTGRPDCTYLLRKGDSAQVHRLLERGETRLGFAGTKLDEARFDYHPLVRDKLVLLTADTPRFRALREKGAAGLDLLGEPMVCREPGSGTRRQFDDYLLRTGVDPASLRVAAQIDQPEAILRAVEAGVGVAVFSALAARSRIDAGSVLAFELGPQSLYRDLYLVTLRRAALSPLERAFFNHTLKAYPADPS